MDLKWNPDRVSHPGSSEDQEIDLNWQGNRNPSLLIKGDGELLMDEHLSPRKLKILAGVDDLQQVKALEMQVDTREISLGNFGVHLPNLRELKLNNSSLVSVRDLGTSLSHLCVLWMARCGLSDLDGISSCSSLKELYIAYNNISDLSQVTWLDHLEVLDLEGNNIEDINQVQYLRLCCKLSHLTVEGNLICLKPNAESAEDPDYNYRAEVKKLIPHLKYLDRIPASQTTLLLPRKMHEDSLIIKESIKEGGLSKDISWLDPYLGEVAKQSGCSPKPPVTSRPGDAQCSANVGMCSDASLLSSSCPLPDPTVFPDKLFTKDDSSDLTHGSSQAQEGAVFSNTKHYLIPSPPKNPSPASAVHVAAKPWKTRNHRGIKIPSQEEDRHCTQKYQSKAHQENSAQPLDKEPALLGLYSTMAASGSQRQRQPVACTSQQRPFPGPAAVGSPRIRPIMDESPSKEINHQHPAACSSPKASQRFRPMNSAWPLTPRSILQSLPHKSTATKTSQNRTPRS
ncbi:leucine-rich repeat-containing protein 56 isoform X6 [Vidua chalybeata]|uniref:leucine-rich repeat-containing protein 56 isoform X6 n=1 Tax=Vidua chalybeata TaxID=81927 RepID=UPI0023A7BD13|nr:leucine-rich repeat-containing protein 56 isoform X6 [Vidua chalybeata]